ncbi:hypothetical protein [uncultured Marixanthomonas sp.]|uniref:hypothetical protein n=1 Tax=uncultured Marixanthomonas sp. TaxID=757245 RepID=UPI0030D900C8|tara:strand:- start:288419 stop:289387 length:969 start_codon:yes stop_codon:yes gene_type:complete
MRFLLENVPYNEPDDSVTSNQQNGNEAEVLGAANLLRAMGAEVSWGSRNEDGRKIDLIASYDHPWIKKERVLILVQVKSGPTYGEKTVDGFKLFSASKKAVMRTSHPICLIWIDREIQCNYWAYIHPHSTPSNQTYKDNHRISPPMRFDIARSQSKFIPNKQGGKGVIMPFGDFSDLKQRRSTVLNEYKSLKNKNLVNPNLGIVEITRIGWRHMFRKNRAAQNKESSLVVIPYLEKIIQDKPTSIYVSDLINKAQDNYKYRRSEYVLSYEDVKLFKAGATNSVKVVIRLIEEIRWPEDWISNAYLSQLIDRKVSLLSSYYKE